MTGHLRGDARKRLAEDDYTRTEDAARHAAALLGRSESIGDGGEPGPDQLLDEPDARLRPDPWLPYTCPRCGDEDRTGMPETCTCCGWRNYG